MPESIPSLPAVFDPSELATASAALCAQFGDASAEAYRRAALRELLDRASLLAQALEMYLQGARMHFRGLHCTADMQSEVTVLSSALSAWSDSVSTAADAYRDWQERRMSGDHHLADNIAHSPVLVLDAASPP
jgi:hypothetical protein